MPQPFSQEKRSEWKDKIDQQKSSNKSITAWCRENHVLTRSFYYWRSKLFPKIMDSSCFTEIKNTESSDIIIECKGVRICLDKHFDSTSLKYCIAMLKGIKC